MSFSIDKIERSTNRDDLAAELVKRFAPWPLMDCLINMSKKDLSALRKRFGIVRPNGRISRLSPEAEKQVLALWDHLEEFDVMERCLVLSQKTDIMVHQLWPIIQGKIHPAY